MFYFMESQKAAFSEKRTRNNLLQHGIYIINFLKETGIFLKIITVGFQHKSRGCIGHLLHQNHSESFRP